MEKSNLDGKFEFGFRFTFECVYDNAMSLFFSQVDDFIDADFLWQNVEKQKLFATTMSPLVFGKNKPEQNK